MKISKVAAAVVVLALATTGCEDNWQSFYIEVNKVPGEPPGCEVPVEEGGLYRADGTLDVALLHRNYVACLLMKNALLPREDYGLPRTESNNIFLQGFYLTVEGDPNLPGYSYPAIEFRTSGFIQAGGLLLTCFDIITDEVGDLLAQDLALSQLGYLQIIVRVQAYGITQGSLPVLTQEFLYPIVVCNGFEVPCLVTCMSDMTPGNGQCDCPTTIEDLDEEAVPCLPGQDELVDYCALELLQL